MVTFTALPSVPSDHLVPFTDQLRLAVAACLARFNRSSRCHTEPDLSGYLAWRGERSLDPLTTTAARTWSCISAQARRQPCAAD